MSKSTPKCLSKFTYTLCRTVTSKPSDSLPLVANDGAVGDPASIGVAVLLANWTISDSSDTAYAIAASGQLEYLLNDAPRSDSGAISQRTDEVQLWYVNYYIPFGWKLIFVSVEGLISYTWLPRSSLTMEYYKGATTNPPCFKRLTSRFPCIGTF